MRLAKISFFIILAGVNPCASVQAQEDSARETQIHRNVRLVEKRLTPNVPAKLAGQYQEFLPIFKDVLAENTQDQDSEKSLIINIAAGVKEVGSSKTRRALAHVTAFCRNSRREYVGDFILHSYVTNGPVNREETEQFLRKQILEPMGCYVPTERVDAPKKTQRETPAVGADVKPAASEESPGVVEMKQEPIRVVAEAKPAAPGRSGPAPQPPAAERSPADLDKPVPGIEVHKNIYLFDAAADPEIPADLASQYRNFLPVFRDILRESTRDQSEENRLIMRVAAGIREVGPARTKRAQVRITSLIGNTNKEYISDFSLYSYENNDIVSREEVAQFLRRHVLEPLECYAPAPPEPRRESIPATVEPEPAEAAIEPRTAESNRVPGERSDRESEIRKNVRLIEFAAPPDLPDELASRYHAFLPMFREVLKENTRDQAEKDHLIIRITAGMREVGSAKTRHAQARVTAFCRNSKRQYIGNFILHSYATGGPVNKEETEQFLRKQILEPLECYRPAENIVASPQSE